MTRPLVSFDLDGVLIENPFRTCVVPQIAKVLRSSPRLATLPDREADAYLGAAIREAWRERQRSGAWAPGYDWDAIYGGLARELGAPSPPDVAELVARCCDRPGTIRLLDGAADGLDRLAAGGVRLVAMTNGFARYQVPVLRALGVLERFEAVLAPDTLGTAKPDPGVFDGLDGLVAHVGDTQSHDVAAANAAGIRSVWIPQRPSARAALGGTPLDALDDATWNRAWAADPYAELYPQLTSKDGRAHAAASTPSEAATLVLGWLGAGTT